MEGLMETLHPLPIRAIPPLGLARRSGTVTVAVPPPAAASTHHTPNRRAVLAAVRHSREQRVIWMLLAIWMLSFADGILTVWASRNGLLTENNPIAAYVLRISPTAVLIYKGLLMALGTPALICYRDRRFTEALTAAVFVVFALVILQWSLVSPFYEIMHSLTPAGYIVHP
jgi:hypothetical protein